MQLDEVHQVSRIGRRDSSACGWWMINAFGETVGPNVQRLNTKMAVANSGMVYRSEIWLIS